MPLAEFSAQRPCIDLHVDPTVVAHSNEFEHSVSAHLVSKGDVSGSNETTHLLENPFSGAVGVVSGQTATPNRLCPNLSDNAVKPGVDGDFIK